MLEKSFYELQNDRKYEKSTMDLVINLEVLQGCSHSCHGCFVNTENLNATPELDIANALGVAEYYTQNNLNFREITIGSTDLFTANNSESVLTNKNLQRMLNNLSNTSNLGIVATGVFDNLDPKRLKHIFSILDDYYRDDLVIEFTIPTNIEKILNKDKKYVDDHLFAIDFFKSANKKVAYVFANNIHNNKWLKEPGMYNKCSQYVEDNFKTVLDHNPSFFRSINRSQIKSAINAWRGILDQSISPDNLDTIHIPSASFHHDSLNTLGILFKEGKAYALPFVYEYVPIDDSSLQLDLEIYENISDQYSKLLTKALKYSKQSDCYECPYLITCAGRHVQNVMEIVNITECIFPQKFITLYSEGM